MKILKPTFWNKKYHPFAITLLPISLVYQFLFDLKKIFTKQKKFSVPIICVGNIYLGGTGKTPSSIKIFEILRELNMKPVVIKKDYKNHKDEVLLLKKYCETIVCSERSDGITKAIEKKFNVIILDDGYQDFKIKKNISIICFNSQQKLGNGLNIPAGPLRQNLKSLTDCQIIFLNGSKNNNFEEELKKYNSNLNFLYYKYIPENLNDFKNKKLIAFAGIGNPENFFELLKINKLNIIKEIKYPDHYDYSAKDLSYLNDLKNKHSGILITTEKDYMRINSENQKNLHYLKIKINFEKQEFLKQILKQII